MASEDVERLRQRLVAIRKRRKISQSRMAEALNISRQAFQKLERPGRDVEMTTVLRWTDALDVDLILIDRRLRAN